METSNDEIQTRKIYICPLYTTALGDMTSTDSLSARARTSPSQPWAILAMPSGTKKRGNYYNCPSPDLA